MKKMIVVALLITLGLSVAAPAVDFAQWKVAVANEDAALTYVRTGVQPTQITTLPALKYLDADAFVGFDYVAYIGGFLTPPQDGEYTFYTASDDDSGLWLSPDEDIAKAVKIAALRGWSPADAWLTGGSATRTSGKATLKAGQKYAFCMTFRNGAAGGTNGSAGWMGPGIADGNTITVIDGQYITDAGPDSPVITGATGTAALVGQAATLKMSMAPAFRPWAVVVDWYKVDAAGDVKVGSGAQYTVAAMTDADDGQYYAKAGSSQSPNVTLDVTHGLMHRYTFNPDDVDSVVIFDVMNQTGDNAGLFDGLLYDLSGKGKFQDGKYFFGNTTQGSAGGANGAANGDYIDLPNGMISAIGTQMTVESWYTQTTASGGEWQRIWDFGTSNGGEDVSGSGSRTAQIYLSPRRGGGQLFTEYRAPSVNGVADGAARGILATPSRPIPINVEVALTVVWDEVAGLCKMYYNGVIVGRNLTNFKLSQMIDNNNWIGRSQWGDPLLQGALNELRIWDTALSAAEIARHALVGPNDTSLAPAATCARLEVGDMNGDCVVDFVDYAMMVERWMLDVTPLL